ncbi:hypothetical protein P9A14_08320 [Gordonia hongkongensis]|uniref:Uncharacterized protein n=1 Tax=Gordonia hongkongensis TaxID=1701090 RepID=A0AAX3TD46_9ACTN|nr:MULTISPECIES: hypothetical protein [Gordonia]OCW87063.1 hypothetical protein A8M60_18525 [Nocardia farcinica]PZT92646.1 MAG: hypothetical protein DI630_28110 [Gordonia sp. (in: high G+C Gram-positive bacteria)]QIK48631.1 hypothetical protein G8C36_16425 [Gordonia terrae]MBN0971288.1 hypothetical protein [Gordonia sp. BP-119]MBN0983651.1 hypothetical protein [Gordonia sp. BP-94]
MLAASRQHHAPPTTNHRYAHQYLPREHQNGFVRGDFTQHSSIGTRIGQGLHSVYQVVGYSIALASWPNQAIARAACLTDENWMAAISSWCHTGYVPEELSATEAARYRAAFAAGADMRSAYTGGDTNERQAAAAALWQSLTKIDPEHTGDKLHIPDDAGPYREALTAILCRIPDGWGRWISCDAGWYRLICQLDRQLAAIDPGYEVHQVKEKFGALRYYFATSPGLPATNEQRMDDLVAAAETASCNTCERCGHGGIRQRSTGQGIRTLCADCADTLGGYSQTA